MNNAKWTWFAIGYQCVFAYVVAFIVYQIGSLFAGGGSILGAALAAAMIAGMIFMLLRPAKASHS